MFQVLVTTQMGHQIMFPFVPKSLTEMWGDKKTQSTITKAFCQHVVYETLYLKFPAGT